MIIALAAALASQLSPQPSREQLEAGLLALRAQDVRVATIGHRLATANTDLCATPVWRHGIALHDSSFYGGNHHPVAVRIFRLGDRPAVLAVAADGPAARSGLQPDDELVAIDGRAIERIRPDARLSSRSAERLWDSLETAFADGVAELVVNRNGGPRTIRVEAERGCPSRFQVVSGAGRAMEANGIYVSVTSGMVNYVNDDQELAAALAHELAHNVLEHRRQRNEAGIRRGLLRQFGRNARVFRQQELEADRLSIFLLYRAGYDIDAAARFWNRFGRTALGINDPTHPGGSRRLAELTAEAQRIREARAAGLPVAPPAMARAPAAAGQSDD
jgi:predicted Zn-dependent protease